MLGLTWSIEMGKLVKCEDCGKKVSINAMSCPKCGSLIQNQVSVQQQISKQQEKQAKYKASQEKNIKVLNFLFSVIVLFFAYRFISVSVLSALLLITASVLSLWFIKDFIQAKKPIKRSMLTGLSVILLVVGYIVGVGAENKAWQEKLDANPELARQVEREKAERTANKAKEQAERERQDKTSEAMLLMRCEEVIKPTLKSPKSMQVDVSSSEYGHNDGKPAVIMHYYAENSFGASILSKAFCTFDENGRLLKVEAVN